MYMTHSALIKSCAPPTHHNTEAIMVRIQSSSRTKASAICRETRRERLQFLINVTIFFMLSVIP